MKHVIARKNDEAIQYQPSEFLDCHGLPQSRPRNDTRDVRDGN